MVIYLMLMLVVIAVSIGVIAEVRRSDKTLEEKQKFFMILGAVATLITAILSYLLIFFW